VNTQLTIFLVRRWWWMWLLCAVTSASTGVLGALSLLLFTAIYPIVVLIGIAEKEGLGRVLNFMTLRRSEVQRSLLTVLVVLPSVCLVVGVLAGRGLAAVMGWKGAEGLSAWHIAVAAAHALVLLLGVYVLVQALKAKIGAQGLQAASGLLPMVMIMSGQYLNRSERETVLAYLDHPAALLVALWVVPLGLWTWKVAPELGWGSVSRGKAEPVKVVQRERMKAKSFKGMRGIKLLFGMEGFRFGWLIASTVGVFWLIYGLNFMRSGEFNGINLLRYVWFMPILFLLFVMQDLKELRLLGLSAYKLAWLMLVAPVLCAVFVTTGMVWMSPTSRDGWELVALFAGVLGATSCLRLFSLYLPYYGLILFMVGFISLAPWLGLSSAQEIIYDGALLGSSGVVGGLLAVGCWWMLVRSFSRGRYIYALNQKHMAKMQPLKGG